MCELLLIFQSIDNKIRNESVFKQWQRLVFNKQQKLIINFAEKGDNSLVCGKDCNLKTALLHVLKRRSFIIEIHILCGLIDSEILSIICKNCIYLENLVLRQTVFEDMSSQDFTKFGQNIGIHLK